MEEVMLEKMRVGLSQRVSSRLLYDMEIDVATDFIAEQLRVTITGNVLKLGKGKSIEIRYPADWWQAFKERWFSRWALERWPVRYHVHHIKAEALFPEASQRVSLEPRFGPSYVTLFENEGMDPPTEWGL